MVSGESEVNSLASCFQSVVHDLKTSNSSLDLVCSRANKLANQLNATMTCLIGFTDAIQVISDSAKWSSRDIGVSLTRFCLRQRALENEMKVFTSALTESFSAPLEKKGTEWKQRLNEIERRHNKNLKKTRSKKQAIVGEVLVEHRARCSELLLEQRNQFSTFSALLVPVIDAQVRLFEEGLHLKAVKETIEHQITTNNSKDIISTVLEDVCHSDDASWRKRMASPTRNMQLSGKPHFNDSSSSPSTSSMALSWNQNDNNSVYYGTVSSVNSSRPQTLSSTADFGKRASISAQTFVPPISTPFVQSPSCDFAKPPLPRRYIDGNNSNGNGNNGNNSHANGNNGNQIGTQPINAFSVSTNDVSHQPRPLSFNGDDSQFEEGKNGETHSLSEQISNLVDKFNDEIHSMCEQTLPNSDVEHGSRVVRRLGSEPASVPGSISLTQRLSVDAMRRPDSIRPSAPAPLPPERRNSTISAATPTAPSIFDLRNAGVFGRQGTLNGRVRSIHDINQITPATDKEYGVVYRAPFSQSADTSNYSNQNYAFEELPELSSNSNRANSYQAPGFRPPPPAYNNYNSQF